MLIASQKCVPIFPFDFLFLILISIICKSDLYIKMILNFCLNQSLKLNSICLFSLGQHRCLYQDKCSHFCHNTPDGFICTCPPTLHLHPNRLNCTEMNPCTMWGTCSQSCEYYNKYMYKCSCEPGYQLLSDHFSCKSTGLSSISASYTHSHTHPHSASCVLTTQYLVTQRNSTQMTFYANTTYQC